MFRSATTLLAKAKPAKDIVRPTHSSVSPYALFLIDTAGHKALAGLEIKARGAACGKLWNSLSQEKKAAYAMKAMKTDPFLIHKGLPRNAPPFGRYVKEFWHKSPKDMAFEDRVCFLAERFNKSVAARAAKQ